MKHTTSVALCSLTLPLCASPLIAQNDQGTILTVAEVWSSHRPAEAPFGTVDGMVETEEGEVWVSDGMGARIVVLSATGEFVRSFGRRGEGPGEFSGPRRLATTGNNAVAVFDVGRSSIELFDTQGQFLERTLLDHPPFNSKGFLVLDDGSYMLTGGV